MIFGPWPKGVINSIGEGANNKGAVRQALGLVGDVIGSMRYIAQGQRVAQFGTYTPVQVIQWGDDYVQCESRPISEVYVDDGTTQTNLYTGTARAVEYDGKLFAALNNGSADQARVYANSGDLTQYCYLGNNIAEGWVASISGSGPYTITFDNSGDYVYPNNAGTPRYALFIDDADKGATTADVRAVSNVVKSGDDITSVDVTANPSAVLAVGQRVRLIVGSSATDTLKPSSFFVWRDRLGCVYNDQLWFAGYPGRADVPESLAPVNPQDWTYWSGLNFHEIGSDRFGAIQMVVPVGDELLVFRQSQVCLVYGYPPINAALDNQLSWRIISEESGINRHGAAAVVRDGQAVAYVGDAGFYLYEQGRAQPIDSAILENHRHRSGFDVVASARDFVVFMDIDEQPELVAQEASGKHSGILEQSPLMWLYYLPTGSWTAAVRMSTNTSRHFVPFDNPGWSGGVCSVTHSGIKKLAIGTNGELWTLLDPDIDTPDLDECHVQSLITHAQDNGKELLQFTQAVVHTEQPYADQELFTVLPAEGKNAGASKDLAVRNAISKTVGDLSIYAGYPKVAAITPRPSIAVGYFGDALLAGVDRNYTSYVNVTAAAQAACTRHYINGRVDRVDVYCKSVTTFDVVIYADDGTGLPDNSAEVRRFTVTAPKGGIKSVSDGYWYSVEFGKGGWTPTAGYFHIGVIGTATFQATPFASTIYNADATVNLANHALILRVIQEVGGPFVCKEIKQIAADVVPAGTSGW